MSDRLKKWFTFMAFILVIYFSAIMIAKAQEITPELQYQNAVEIWQASSSTSTTLAIRMWKEIATEHNHIPSMWALTFAYMQGVKVDRNIPEVIQWLTKLSDLRQADAKEMLGDMYYYGRDVPQNYEMAAKWYVNYFEVEQDADILMRYATLLATGQGVTKNLIASWKMLRKASEDDRYKISTYLLAGMVFAQMSPFEQFKIRFFMNQQQNN